MDVIIYHNPACSTSRNRRRLMGTGQSPPQHIVTPGYAYSLDPQQAEAACPVVAPGARHDFS